MKILHTVEFYHPSKGGAQEVVRQISEHLAERGHDVTVATTRIKERRESVVNGVKIEAFDIAGSAVVGFRGETQRYQQFLLDSDFDLMLNYAAQQWTADLAFPVLERLPYGCVFIPCGFSGLYKPEYASYYSQMPDVLRRYNHLIFHAEQYRDIEFARQHGIKNFSIIPNGASQTEFEAQQPSFRKRYNIPEKAALLLTVGSHTRLKGHRVTIQAFQRAHLENAVLVIIGNLTGGRGCLPDCRRRAWWANLVSAGRKRILLLDPPRPEVVAAFQAADLFVFASNIEYSPLVLFEAMASHTPFLTVACGNAAEIAAWSGGGQVLPTQKGLDGRVYTEPETLARGMESMLADAALRRRLAQAGYEAWKARFTWEKLAGEYERVYREVAERRIQKSPAGAAREE